MRRLRGTVLHFYSPQPPLGLSWAPGTEKVLGRMLCQLPRLAGPGDTGAALGATEGSLVALMLCVMLMLETLCQAVAAPPGDLSLGPDPQGLCGR